MNLLIPNGKPVKNKLKYNVIFVQPWWQPLPAKNVKLYVLSRTDPKAYTSLECTAVSFMTACTNVKVFVFVLWRHLLAMNKMVCIFSSMLNQLLKIEVFNKICPSVYFVCPIHFHIFEFWTNLSFMTLMAIKGFHACTPWVRVGVDPRDDTLGKTGLIQGICLLYNCNDYTALHINVF